MTLYEINAALEALVDEETGELLDYEAFDNLLMERDEKLENIGLWIKDLRAEAAALKAEKEALAKRQRTAENKAERLASYMQMMLAGEKFKTSKVAVSYRTSKSVEVEDGFVDWAVSNGDQYLRFKEPEVNKEALKEALKNGEEIPYVGIVEKVGVVIK